MSRVNFRSCETLGDVERLHREVLPGKLLIEFDESKRQWVDGKPWAPSVRMPIFGIYAAQNTVVFEAEKVVGERLAIAFKVGQEVVTSVMESGDIFWSPDDYKKSVYTIDDLSEEDFDFDGLLRRSIKEPLILTSMAQALR